MNAACRPGCRYSTSASSAKPRWPVDKFTLCPRPAPPLDPRTAGIKAEGRSPGSVIGD